MQYQEFLDHIYRRYSGNVKLELGRMEGLLKDMGDPQDQLRGFHVAGTNGKGSICASLEALALAHGCRTGLNTSPHLIDYTERFRTDGRDLDIQVILEAFNEYEALFNKWEASFFEITTAIAFALFARQKPDLSIIEVGLGGRLDATNLFLPDICAISTIGLDHIKTLGNNLQIIASEKAGIIKSRVPLVLGDIEKPALDVILEKAMAKAAPVYQFGKDWKVEIVSDSTAGICFDYAFGKHFFPGLKSNLMGEHQAANIGLAITAFILYCQKHKLQISEKNIRNALMQINWAGRMQVLSTRPTVIVDGAHNVHGVNALMATLNKVFPERKLGFVISILADKDYSEMIRLFALKAKHIYVAQNKSDRAASAEDQLLQIAQHRVPASSYPTVAEAYRTAVKDAGPDGVVVAGGSLYTVGEVISAYREDA
ncbi:MAG: folylpolyglutamate synthase/dihydrofolate synthase family protein [Candidatus Cloacimonadaceae bacterium]|nr:bifunctional folylpolyglutamate synthase/dihydrofolate synthase [Candidatus Cloacimonadota bacterium]